MAKVFVGINAISAWLGFGGSLIVNTFDLVPEEEYEPHLFGPHSPGMAGALTRFIVNNPTDSPETAFYNIITSLKPLLTEVYDTDERFQKLLERVIKYTLDFENITLINPNIIS